ncbi:hypothetical protein WNY61_09955 [Sulfitobacter sp. AS92]|uniref:hypothetical protein n=1 Tax=Sulfitobacter sp. AS92 TaxID=3135783 RepID=UPI003177F723
MADVIKARRAVDGPDAIKLSPNNAVPGGYLDAKISGGSSPIHATLGDAPFTDPGISFRRV